MNKKILLPVLFFASTVSLTAGKLHAQEPLISADSLPARYNESVYFNGLYANAKPEFGFRSGSKSAFIAWQKAFLLRLKQALGLSKLEQQYAGYTLRSEKMETEDKGYYILEKWVIWTEPAVPLPVVVMKPKNIKGKLPLVIATHGHGKNADLYDGIYPNVLGVDPLTKDSSIALHAVSDGYIAIAPTIRAFGDTRTEYDKQNGNSFSCHVQLMRDLLVGRTPIGDRVWDMSKVLDWAFLHLPVDENRVAITGNSGGGTVSLFAAACDQRISIAAPSSYFCTFQGSIGSIAHCDCNYIPGMLELGEMSNVAGLIAPRPLRLLNGKEDRIFPIAETRKAFAHLKTIYAASGMPDNVMLYEGNGGHQYYGEAVWPFFKQFLKKAQ